MSREEKIEREIRSTKPEHRQGETFAEWDRRWRNALIRRGLWLGLQAVLLVALIVTSILLGKLPA